MAHPIGLACHADLAHHWSDRIYQLGWNNLHIALGERASHPRTSGWVLVFQPYERPSDYQRWIAGLRAPVLIITDHVDSGVRVADQLRGAIVVHPDHANRDLPDLLALLGHSQGRTLVLRPRFGF